MRYYFGDLYKGTLIKRATLVGVGTFEARGCVKLVKVWHERALSFTWTPKACGIMALCRYSAIILPTLGLVGMVVRVGLGFRMLLERSFFQSL